LFHKVAGATCPFVRTAERDAATCAVVNGTAMIGSLKYGQCPTRKVCGLCIGMADQVIKSGQNVIIVFEDRYVDGVDYPKDEVRPGLSIVGSASMQTAGRERHFCAQQPQSARPADFGAFLNEPANVIDLSATIYQQWCKDKDCSKRIANLRYCGVFSPAVVPKKGPSTSRRVTFSELRVDGGTMTPPQEVQDLTSTNEGAEELTVLAVMHAQKRGFKFVRIESTTTTVFYTLMLHMEHFINDGDHPITVVFQLTASSVVTETNLNELYTSAPKAVGKPCQLFWSALTAVFVLGGAHPDVPAWFSRGVNKFWSKAIEHKTDEYLKALGQLGNDFDPLPAEALAMIEAMVCEVYQLAQEQNPIYELNKLRCELVDRSHTLYRVLMAEKARVDQQMDVSASGTTTSATITVKKPPQFDWARLPPAHTNFKQHMKRVNYIVARLKRVNQTSFIAPNPWEHERGWALDAIPGRPKEHQLVALDRPDGEPLLPAVVAAKSAPTSAVIAVGTENTEVDSMRSGVGVAVTAEVESTAGAGSPAAPNVFGDMETEQTHGAAGPAAPSGVGVVEVEAADTSVIGNMEVEPTDGAAGQAAAAEENTSSNCSDSDWYYTDSSESDDTDLDCDPDDSDNDT